MKKDDRHKNTFLHGNTNKNSTKTTTTPALCDLMFNAIYVKRL